jgi:hypothetical protein
MQSVEVSAIITSTDNTWTGSVAAHWNGRTWNTAYVFVINSNTSDLDALSIVLHLHVSLVISKTVPLV